MSTATRALAAACLLITACSASRRSGPPAQPPLQSIGARTHTPSLVAVGKDVDVNHHRAQGMGLVHAPKLQASLQSVLDRVATQAPVQGMNARVYVRATNAWGAAATADANIYLNLGTLRDLESEDELAAILAHELSHVILEHHDSDAVESAQERAIQLSLLAAMASGMAGAGAAVGQATQAIYAGATSLKATQAVVSPAWQRDQEAEADFLAADLVAKAGWDPQALAAVLEKQQSHEEQKTDEIGFVESVKQSSLSAIGPSGFDQKKFSEGLTNAVKGWLTRTAQDLARSHPDTGLRIVEVTAYVDAHYPAAVRPSRNSTAWAKVVNESATKKVLGHYADADEAEARLASGDRREAEKLARSAASGTTKDHAKPVLTLVAVESGARRKEAQSMLRTSAAGPEPSFAAYREAARIAAESGDGKEAVRLLEQGWTSLDRPPEAIPPLIQAYKRNKQDAQASLLSAECAVRYPKYHLAGLCSTEDTRSASR